MTTKKKKKAKQSSPGRSASTSPSSSTQTSGDNKQQIAQSTASSSPVNCDLAAADIAGSDTNPFSDLLLEHNATGQIENGAIDLDLMDNDEIPLTFTKEFVGITQETSTNQSALPAVAEREPMTCYDIQKSFILQQIVEEAKRLASERQCLKREIWRHDQRRLVHRKQQVRGGIIAAILH
ncbi:hypothetical protein DY000_02012342 [Brassica cretica]|uniref:MYB-CC type transcription factor LHEQLE-containing domain-containing protein n=1 Tax=Brassica cretica TaxID=69181 RepID=A0ABQ7CZA9_BRACR|nr:hypothetical protein DY000_02012342 [Brassica cretica]